MTAYWQLDETVPGVYADAVGNRQGQCAGQCPVPSVYGSVRGAQIFNGKDTGIDIPATGIFQWNQNESFSVVCRMKKSPGTLAGDETVMEIHDSGTGMKFHAGIGKIGSGGVAVFLLRDSSGKTYTLQGTANLADGYWHSVVWVRDAGSSRNFLYVDAQLEISSPAVYSGNFISENASLHMGWSEMGDSYSFRGHLDEIAIYAKALTAGEIRENDYNGLSDIRWGYCDSKPKVRIMPLGDSITAGFSPGLEPGFQVGYRQKLYQDLLASGYDADFAGSQTYGSSVPDFDWNSEGWQEEYTDEPAGRTAAELKSEVYGLLNANLADIVLLHIGTYDTLSQNADSSDTEAVLDEIDRFDPEIAVVLALIINGKSENPRITQYNSALLSMAKRRIANGDKIILVNQENALTYSLDISEDGIHPTTSGYRNMADAWFSALARYPESVPIADAGEDQQVFEKSTVALDGSESFDPNGPLASYLWTQISGPAVSISNASAMKTSFTSPAYESDLTFRLSVQDQTGLIRNDEIIIHVSEYPLPQADPGQDQSVKAGATVVLDGSASFATDAEIVSYQWSQISGTPVKLTASAPDRVSFAAPDPSVPEGETLVFLLTVTDDKGKQDSGEVRIHVEKTLPVADPGEDQTVNSRDTVTLDGSASSAVDGEIVAYQWAQVSGTAVNLADSDKAKAAFSAPDTDLEGETLIFSLTVTDSRGKQDTAEISIHVINGRPVANAGKDQTVTEGMTVTLDGSGSYDPDGGIASYQWIQQTGSAVALSNANAVQTTFVAPKVGDVGLVFALFVKDKVGLESRDEVLITVNANGISGFPDSVTTFASVTGMPIGINVESGGILVKLSSLDSASISATDNRPENLPYGLTDLEIRLDSPGGQAVVTFYLPEPAPAGYLWYGYGTAKGWLAYNDAVFSADRKEIRMTFIDAGSGDEGDSSAAGNGIIKNISGPGYIPPPEEEDKDELISCFVQTSFDSFADFFKTWLTDLKTF
ncbi:MAG: PKD domain-containing protein [Desulfobacterales bacterium]